MRRLSPADYRVMPWKNGGGTTTELYAAPAPSAAPALPFLWRVSIAEVAADGPFSRFDGYDRHIMCISGAGMVLHGGPAGPIDVTARFTPQRFSGDWTIASRLVSGQIRDFNLIAAGRRLESRLDCRLLAGPETLGCGPGQTVFVYVLDGAAQADGFPCPAGTSFLLAPGERIRLEPEAGAAPVRLALCHMVEPRLAPEPQPAAGSLGS